MKTSIGTLLLLVAITGAIGGATAGAAFAKDDRHHRHEQEWRWRRDYRPYGYGAPVVVAPPAPEAYYAPAPVYAPPPAPPSINFVFPIRIH